MTFEAKADDQLSKFNKRHYDFLANWLKNANMALYSTTDRALVRQSLTDWLERDNPNFNRDKFLKASRHGD